MLDVVAMMLCDQDVSRACVDGFLSTVERSLIGQDEKGYWDRISRRLQVTPEVRNATALSSECPAG